MKSFLWILIIPLALSAQSLDIFGYFEPQYMGATLGDKFYNVASNKLRVDLQKSISDNVTFGANFDYITFHGKTEWNILDYLPERITTGIPPQLADAFVFYFGDMVQQAGPLPQPRPDRIFLDNAYMRLTYKRFDVTIGKQQLGMGAGYTWNPTDLFNIKDVLDPTYEQPGHNAIKIDFQVSNSTALQAIWAPGEEFENSHNAIKLKSTVGRFDLSIMAARHDWYRSDFINFTRPGLTYRRTLVGGDFAGELLGIGIWGEGAYSLLDPKEGQSIAGIDDYWEAVIGMDFTFQSGLYTMAEVYHNSQAPDDWKKYTLNDWLWYFATETRAISRDNLFALVQYPATDLATVGLMLINSISDGSATVAPMLMWSLFDDVEFLMYANFNTGRDGQAFAANLGNGLLARLRVYF